MWYRYSVCLAVLLSLGASKAQAQRRTLTGRVLDDVSGAPIRGAQVVIRGTTTGTLGKGDGVFSISVPNTTVTLEVTFIGYKRADVVVPATQSNVQVRLKVDVLKLDEIVVTGQATTVARRNLANAVATVNSRQLATVPATDISQALQGKLSGANILESSGAPGGASTVTLRGVTSINGAFTPLYVIDGVIASDVAIPRGTNFVTQAARGNTVATIGENATDRIADLNPNDIENIEVLKGAAASAIYGSKASNGVIIITTKRGKTGAPQYTLTQRFGTASNSHFLGERAVPTLAAAEAQYGAKADDPITGWKPGVFFDNEKALSGNHPTNYETMFSVSGGTDNTRYYLSAASRYEGGVVTNTYAKKRSFRLNLDQTAGERVTFGASAEVLNTDGDKGLTINENNNSSYWASLANTPSWFDMTQRADGTWAPNPFVASNALHTAAVLKNRELVNRMIASAHVSVDLIKSTAHTLRFLGNAGADFFNQDNTVYSPPELEFEPLDGLLGTSVASESRNLNVNINLNGVYTYKRSNLQATTQVGTQYETRELKIERILGANLIGGLQVVTAGTQLGVDAQHTYVKDQGFFGQEEVLMLNEKLLLTAGLRADRSSNDGDPSKMFYYPKASASYRLTGLATNVLDELKLRAAVGQSGNQPLYGQKFTALLGGNVGGVGAAQIQTTAAASNIVPEREREIEAGFDATLFKGRAHLEATGYDKHITDLLLSQSLPTSYGFTSRFLNGGTLQTRGLELTLSGLPVQTKNLTINPRISFSRYRSTILKLPVPKFGGGGFGGGSIRIEEGGSATAFWGNDTTADGKTVVAKLGETRPDYNMQYGSDIKYKSLGFSFAIDRQKGGLVSCLTCWLYDLDGVSKDWDTPAPDGTPLGKFRPAIFTRYSRMFVQDASYWKLREATFSWDVPSDLTSKLWGGAHNVRLTASGRNLWTSTPYQGTDPEQRWQPENGIAKGNPSELWAYPPSRTFWLGAEVGF
jgi:TonB-linked SusC/RagA family outer membrane protein